MIDLKARQGVARWGWSLVYPRLEAVEKRQIMQKDILAF